MLTLYDLEVKNGLFLPVFESKLISILRVSMFCVDYGQYEFGALTRFENGRILGRILDDFGGQKQGPNLDRFWRSHSGEICSKRSFWRSKTGSILGRKVGQKYVIFGDFWRVLHGCGPGFGDFVQACWHGVARWRRGPVTGGDRNLIEIS